MVQNLKAYLLLYVITIKLITFLNVTDTKVELKETFMRYLLSYKDKATIKNCKGIPGDGKTLASCGPIVVFTTPSHPIANGLAVPPMVSFSTPLHAHTVEIASYCI